MVYLRLIQNWYLLKQYFNKSKNELALISLAWCSHLLAMFHMCFFSLCPHSVFTTKFPLSVPAYMPFYQLVSSSKLRVVRATAHIFITSYGEENWLPQKGHRVHIENLIFFRAFSSTRASRASFLHLPR